MRGISVLGDMGVATSTDAFSQQLESREICLLPERKMGIGLSYTLIGKVIINGYSIVKCSFHSSINERSALSRLVIKDIFI